MNLFLYFVSLFQKRICSLSVNEILEPMTSLIKRDEVEKEEEPVDNDKTSDVTAQEVEEEEKKEEDSIEERVEAATEEMSRLQVEQTPTHSDTDVSPQTDAPSLADEARST